MSKGRMSLLTLSAIGLCLVRLSASPGAQNPPRTTFRSAVTLVPITAVVRDGQNRLVRNLAREDFQVLEQGELRPIVKFGATDETPVSVAFLVDTSGSMPIASNLEKGRGFVEQLLSQMDQVADEASLFTFDKGLRQEVPFTRESSSLREALTRVRPWGLTSLYDAIADTAKQLADRPAQRRAVVVITDGVDTSSTLTAQQVSSLASSIDVPVYVVAVVSPLEHPGRSASKPRSGREGALADLAFWTGGDLFYVSTPGQLPVAAGGLLTAMRQQYVLAIESASAAGWYRLEVRTKRKNLTVRARAGYFAGTTISGLVERQPEIVR